jgi:hypothetical protein
MRILDFVPRNLRLIVIAVFSLFGVALAQDRQPIRSLPIPEARINGPTDIAQGDLWVGWSADHRLGYVQGLLDGTYSGYSDACTEAQIAAPSLPRLNDKCLAHIPTPRLKSEEYTSMVTEFYSRYPQDRALPIKRLVMKFLEPGMTVDGVHKWLDELIESVHRSQAK